jgi:hypothetical protein
MHSFSILPFRDRRGLQYYYASWPVFDRVPKKSGRGRRKFTTRGEAEEFLVRARAEFRKDAEVILAHDRNAQLDFLRAMDVLKELVPGSTLEKAALLLRRCQSKVEKRDGTFEAPASKDRTIELQPREYLVVRNTADRNGWTLADALAKIIHEWLLAQVEEDVRKRVEDEKAELASLEARNKRAEALLKGWRHEGQTEAREAGKADGIEEMRKRHAKRARESYRRHRVEIAIRRMQRKNGGRASHYADVR